VRLVIRKIDDALEVEALRLQPREALHSHEDVRRRAHLGACGARRGHRRKDEVEDQRDRSGQSENSADEDQPGSSDDREHLRQKRGGRRRRFGRCNCDGAASQLGASRGSA
jgi:hypothetical protein